MLACFGNFDIKQVDEFADELLEEFEIFLVSVFLVYVPFAVLPFLSDFKRLYDFLYSKACLTIWFFIVSLTKTIWIVFFWFFEIVFYLNYQAVWMVFCKLLPWHLLWFLVQRVQFLPRLNVWPDQFFVEQFCLFLQLPDW